MLEKGNTRAACFAAITLLLGCSAGSNGGQSAGGGSEGEGGSANNGGSASNGSSGQGGTPWTGGDGGAGGGGTPMLEGPCAPTNPVCVAVPSVCVALENNKGKDSFTLRMANLSLNKPAAITKGIFKNVVQNGVMMNLPKCNLGGGGTFSWLLQFDAASSKLTTGGARPVSDPTQGYSFFSGVLGGVSVGPASVGLVSGGGSVFESAQGVDVAIPIFLDPQGESAIVLPLAKATFKGALSPDGNCIGRYNAEGLDPANNCLSDDAHPAYINTATLAAHITLEAADEVDVASIGQSLCVLLSGDAAQYGDGAKPIAHCKRSGGKIVFQGDWCSGTNSAGGCADAVELSGTFAASAVKLNP